MKKRYLITALITGVALTNVSTLNYFAISASASSQGYQAERSKKTKKDKPSKTEKILPDIYRVRMLIAQNTTSVKKEKAFKTQKDKYFYSLQLGTFKKRKNAEKFLKKLPKELRDSAFIYKTDKGYYTVRYGLFDNYNLLKEIQEKLPVSSIIVKTDITKVAKKEEIVAEEKKIVEKVKKKVEKTEKKEEKITIEEEEKIIPEFEEEEISLFEEEKTEIPLYKKVIGAVFFVPAYMLTHKQRGFWGKVEFTYKMENYKDPYRKTTRKSFRQYYELNYEGYVYSPRLLTYKLGGNFIREDSSQKTGGSKTDTTSKLIGYDIEFNILKNSRFPVNLFARKTQSPLWYTYYDRTSYIERKTDTYGLFGSIRLVNSNVNYSYRKSKSKSVGIDFSEDRKSEEFSFGYGKNWINKYLNIAYKKNIDDYIQRYPNISSYRKVYQDINNFNMDYRWKISRKSNVNSNLRYYSNSYSNIKNLTGNVNYMWMPSQKLTANFGLSATRSDSKNYQLTFFSFNESLSYVINENWNMNHNLILFTSSGTNANQKLLNTGVNISYNRNLSETFSVFGGTGLSGQIESGNVNRVGGTVSVNGGINKRFSFLNSDFTLSGSASEYNSSKNDKSTTYNINERFNAYLLNNLRFEHSINYYYQDSKYYRPSGGFSKTNYDNLEVSNALRYRKLLGWKGKLSSVIGMKYYYGKNRPERIYPYANLNISYKLTRRLLYKLSLDVHRDSYYNTNYATLSTGIDYRIRSLFFKWDFQYFYEDNKNYGKKHNYITQFKVYRVF